MARLAEAGLAARAGLPRRAEAPAPEDRALADPALAEPRPSAALVPVRFVPVRFVPARLPLARLPLGESRATAGGEIVSCRCRALNATRLGVLAFQD